MEYQYAGKKEVGDHTMNIYVAPKSARCIDAPGGQNLYPSNKYDKGTHTHSGTLDDIGGGWYEFSLFNQLPGLSDEIMPGFSGHYSVRFNPHTGGIMYRKFGDYCSLVSYTPVQSEWETPLVSSICTYLRKKCRAVWERTYRYIIVEILATDSGRVVYKYRHPVNIHTGESYTDCYFLLKND